MKLISIQNKGETIQTTIAFERKEISNISKQMQSIVGSLDKTSYTYCCAKIIEEKYKIENSGYKVSAIILGISELNLISGYLNYSEDAKGLLKTFLGVNIVEKNIDSYIGFIIDGEI
jgi:hypothetical protein